MEKFVPLRWETQVTQVDTKLADWRKRLCPERKAYFVSTRD
jgi:hypothetical protein